MLVAEAVGPPKSEVFDLKQRVVALEAAGPTDPNSLPTPVQTTPSELQKLVHSLDPAKKRIVFMGWPDTTSADARIKHIEALLSQHTPTLRTNDVDNIYQGPYSKRPLYKVAFVEFTSADSARRALDQLKDANRQVGDTTLSIKPARSKLNSRRNFSLRKAEELIKASPHCKDKSVSISWDTRAVTVDSTDAFTQGKQDPGGTFLPPFELLALP